MSEPTLFDKVKGIARAYLDAERLAREMALQQLATLEPEFNRLGLSGITTKLPPESRAFREDLSRTITEMKSAVIIPLPPAPPVKTKTVRAVVAKSANVCRDCKCPIASPSATRCIKCAGIARRKDNAAHPHPTPKLLHACASCGSDTVKYLCPKCERAKGIR